MKVSTYNNLDTENNKYFRFEKDKKVEDQNHLDPYKV